jgi:serine protease
MISGRIVLQAGLAASALVFCVAQPGLAQTSDRYIVKFRPGRAAAGAAAVRAAGGQVVVTLGPQDAVAVRIPAAAVNGLSRNPNVEFIEEDAVREPFASANSAAGAETLPYGIQMVQANLVSSTNAAARKICIIDSGYSQQHEDLKADDVTANQTDSGSGTWDRDSCGHGTHVAGTIAAIAGNGVGVVGANPGAALHIVKVFGNDNLNGGACGWTYSSNLVSALNECTAIKANVVSMSLGGALKSRTEENAFAAAYANNVLSIAAVGNGGNTKVSYPAGYASVVSVAALDATETLATFSQRNADVELAAPGVSVLSTVPYKDVNTLTAGSVTWEGGRIDGAPRTAGTIGSLADGDRCAAAGAWTGRVVLCERGDISFADKVKNVQAGGGLAAVIYNNVTSDANCGVFAGTLGDRPRTTIPATTLSCADGALAKGHLGLNGGVVSQMSVPDSGYESFDGTSMATPHVSAVAALVWSCHPALTAAQVRKVLDDTAKDKGAAGRDASFGFGLVQAKAAVDWLKSQNLNINCQ